MKIIKTIVVLAILGSVGYFGVSKYLLPGNASWVHGTWWYANSSGQIVEGKNKDGMLFRPNGSVDLVDGSRNKYLSCVYTDLVDSEIRVECEVRGKNKELIFLIKDNYSKLANVDDPDAGFYIKE